MLGRRVLPENAWETPAFILREYFPPTDTAIFVNLPAGYDVGLSGFFRIQDIAGAWVGTNQFSFEEIKAAQIARQQKELQPRKDKVMADFAAVKKRF